MNDNVLRQFATRIMKPEGDNDQTSDVNDDFGSFGWLRGARDRAIMLELRKKDGSVNALGYAWLERIEYDPGIITLHFTNRMVKITGRNLNSEARPHVRLLDGLCRHRIAWIQEADEPTAMTAAKHATVIERVEFL
jgi:hypothetical protein